MSPETKAAFLLLFAGCFLAMGLTIGKEDGRKAIIETWQHECLVDADGNAGMSLTRKEKN